MDQVAFCFGVFIYFSQITVVFCEKLLCIDFVEKKRLKKVHENKWFINTAADTVYCPPSVRIVLLLIELVAHVLLNAHSSYRDGTDCSVGVWVRGCG